MICFPSSACLTKNFHIPDISFSSNPLSQGPGFVPEAGAKISVKILLIQINSELFSIFFLNLI